MAAVENKCVINNWYKKEDSDIYIYILYIVYCDVVGDWQGIALWLLMRSESF